MSDTDGRVELVVKDWGRKYIFRYEVIRRFRMDFVPSFPIVIGSYVTLRGARRAVRRYSEAQPYPTVIETTEVEL